MNVYNTNYDMPYRFIYFFPFFSLILQYIFPHPANFAEMADEEEEKSAILISSVRKCIVIS